MRAGRGQVFLNARLFRGAGSVRSKLFRNPFNRIRPLIDPSMRHFIGLDMLCQYWFANHLQPPDVRHGFGHTLMLVSQVIDKNGNAWLILQNYLLQSLTLAALVAVNRKIDADRLQLFGTGNLAVIHQVSEDRDVGDFR